MRRLNLLVVLLSVFLISGCVGQDTAPDVESSAVDCFGSFTPGEILPLEVGLSELNSDLTISKEDYVEDGISVVRNIAGFYGPKELEGAKPYLFSINAMELKEGSDFDGYSNLANEKIDAAGYPPKPEEGEEPEESEPIIETAFNWHGGQDSALYAFASTREVQSETHRANTLDEIDTSIDWHKVNQEQHEGDVAKLQRLRQAVKDAKIGERFFYI